MSNTSNGRIGEISPHEETVLDNEVVIVYPAGSEQMHEVVQHAEKEIQTVTGKLEYQQAKTVGIALGLLALDAYEIGQKAQSLNRLQNMTEEEWRD